MSLPPPSPPQAPAQPRRQEDIGQSRRLRPPEDSGYERRMRAPEDSGSERRQRGQESPRGQRDDAPRAREEAPPAQRVMIRRDSKEDDGGSRGGGRRDRYDTDSVTSERGRGPPRPAPAADRYDDTPPPSAVSARRGVALQPPPSPQPVGLVEEPLRASRESKTDEREEPVRRQPDAQGYDEDDDVVEDVRALTPARVSKPPLRTAVLHDMEDVSDLDS